MSIASNLPLYARVVLINGLVFGVGTMALALSPATVSQRPLLSEVVVLTLGITAILVTNAVLLRSSLAPLDRLAKAMSIAALPADSPIEQVTGSGTVATLQHNYNAMLARLDDERDDSNAAALAAQEEERLRISRELHDEVGQALTVALLSLRRVADEAPDRMRAPLEEATGAVRSALEDVRRVARRLRPGVLEDLGLKSALVAVATDLEAGTGVTVHRRFTPGLRSLGADRDLVVYRVAQEALTNVARHASAREVELSLTRQGEMVVLRIADDGRGIAPDATGTGLTGMRERARLASADLTVQTGAGGRGTEIVLRVPRESRND